MAVYWSASRIAAQLRVATGTITKWIDRFAGTAKPFPAPDVEIIETDGRITRGWSPTRWPEIEQWVNKDRHEVRRTRENRNNGTVRTRYTERLFPEGPF